MAEEIDFAITDITCEDGAIENVERCEVLDDGTLGEKKIKTKRAIINAIKDHDYVYRVRYKENGNWRYGAKVRAVPESNPKYIRTDKNNTEKDNLEHIQEC